MRALLQTETEAFAGLGAGAGRNDDDVGGLCMSPPGNESVVEVAPEAGGGETFNHSL